MGGGLQVFPGIHIISYIDFCGRRPRAQPAARSREGPPSARSRWLARGPHQHFGEGDEIHRLQLSDLVSASAWVGTAGGCVVRRLALLCAGSALRNDEMRHHAGREPERSRSPPRAHRGKFVHDRLPRRLAGRGGYAQHCSPMAATLGWRFLLMVSHSSAGGLRGGLVGGATTGGRRSSLMKTKWMRMRSRATRALHIVRRDGLL